MYHLVGINCRYSHSCLALFYVRAALERFLPGCRVGISQFHLSDPYYPTLLDLAGSGARAWFFSTYIWNHHYLERLIRDLAGMHPDKPIIVGGPQAAMLTDLPAQCTLVEGEVEGLAPSFYEDLVRGQLRPYYRAGGGNRFAVPYRDEDLRTILARRPLYYESSRGCPFSCSYCLSSVSHGVRRLSMARVERELGFLLRYRPSVIRFVDRTFNDQPARALALWRFLVRQHAETRYHFEIAPDRFTNDMIDFLGTVEAGMFQFEIGMQSCNPKSLAAVRRTMDPKLAGKNIRSLVALETIHIHVDLILGLPFETRASFLDSFCRVFAMGPHYIQMGLLKLLPETDLRKKAGEYGIQSCRQPPYEILASRWLSAAEIRELYFFGECVEAFVNNRYFSSLWHYLRRGNENPASFFLTLCRLCHEYDFFHQAKTQKIMTRLLATLAATRSDREVVLDLLRFDWLRCGHQSLPDHLAPAGFGRLRRQLRLRLPQNLEPLFTYRERDRFLKLCSFLELSAPSLEALDLPATRGPALICLLPEQDRGVFKHNRFVVLSHRKSGYRLVSGHGHRTESRKLAYLSRDRNRPHR